MLFRATIGPPAKHQECFAGGPIVALFTCFLGWLIVLLLSANPEKLRLALNFILFVYVMCRSPLPTYTSKL